MPAKKVARTRVGCNFLARDGLSTFHNGRGPAHRRPSAYSIKPTTAYAQN